VEWVRLVTKGLDFCDSGGDVVHYMTVGGIIMEEPSPDMRGKEEE
jgi:hypothetical protein